MRPFLVVHLVFHPDSASARSLGIEMHKALNSDPIVPGLRVSTSFVPLDSGQPVAIDFSQADRNFVAILADTKMRVDTGWSQFAADCWSSSQAEGRRCVPFALADDVWPLHKDLSNTNFVRAQHVAGDEQRDLVARRLIVELCRFLHGEALGDVPAPAAPVKLFISHTKLDLGEAGNPVEALTSALGADQPIKTWFDSGDIGAGSTFSDEIEGGVSDTALLCVLTDSYASREWCRREVLLAKEHGRPIVVVDALGSHEIRSFPYLGNVPVVRWTGDAQPAIDLVVKETLRDLVATNTLWRDTRVGEVAFGRPPELLTLALADKPKRVLYPDPPLGEEETALLETTGIEIVTPLSRLAEATSLSGERIALSTSGSSDLAAHGFADIHLEAAMLEMSRYLLIAGATLVYGGHLGHSGYTVQLTELVRAHNAIAGVQPVERLENHVGWPLPLLDAERAKYMDLAELIRWPRPADIDIDLHPDLVPEPTQFLDADACPEFRFAWARGMTEMRRGQTAVVAARIVAGGPTGPMLKPQPDGTVQERWYTSRIPGILEEVLLAIEQGIPVFLLGAFGGIPGLVMDILEGNERPDATWEFHSDAPHATAMRALYDERGVDWVDYPEIAARIRDVGLAGLNPLLTADEHRELFAARHSEMIVEIVLEGLQKL